jgi:hypothetical protein
MDTREADRQVIEKPPVKGTNGTAGHVEAQKEEPQEQASSRNRLLLIAGAVVVVLLVVFVGIPWLS